MRMKKISAILLSSALALSFSVSTFAAAGTTTASDKFTTSVDEVSGEVTLLVTSGDATADIGVNNIVALDQKTSEDGAAVFEYNLKGGIVADQEYTVRVGASNLNVAHVDVVTYESPEEPFDETISNATDPKPVTVSATLPAAIGTTEEEFDAFFADSENNEIGVVIESDALAEPIWISIENDGQLLTTGGRYAIILNGIEQNEDLFVNGIYTFTNYQKIDGVVTLGTYKTVKIDK